MNRWLKFLFGLYGVAWALSLVGCTEANIPKGTPRIGGIPSSISLRVIPDTCVFEEPASGNAIVTVLATVKDELGNPATGSVIFVSTGQTTAPISTPLDGRGVAQNNFTFNCSSSIAGVTCDSLAGNCLFQISAVIADLTSTVNVTVVNVKVP